jgi:hypothetical protein
MKHDIMEGLLNMMCDASMGRLKKDDITFNGVKTYCHYLKSYPDSLIISVIEDLAGSWEKYRLPPVAVISRLCEERETGCGQTPYEAELAENDRIYSLRKAEHRTEVRDFIRRILNDEPLSEAQKERKEIIEPYMENFHGERNIREEFKDLQTPYSWSYTGLYMDTLEGTLKGLTGVKRGNLY